MSDNIAIIAKYLARSLVIRSDSVPSASFRDGRRGRRAASLAVGRAEYDAGGSPPPPARYFIRPTRTAIESVADGTATTAAAAAAATVATRRRRWQWPLGVHAFRRRLLSPREQ